MPNINFLSLATLLLFLSCSREHEPVPQPEGDFRFTFGWYFGYCQGESCIEFFQIAGGKLYEDKLDQYPNLGDPAPPQTEYVARSQADYEAVKDLPEGLPEALFDEEELVIGIPDAGDWGGLYVGLEEGDRIRWRYIDNNKDYVPEYLHDFIDALRASIETLQE